MPKRTAKQLWRMMPIEFVKCCIEDGLLSDLQGSSCVMPACIAGDSEPTAKRTLGKLAAKRTQGPDDVTCRNVWYACKRCRSRYAVTYGSSIFPKVGGGLASLTDNVQAFWKCVHDVSVTSCCHELNLTEPVVRAMYATARKIMAEDALRTQCCSVLLLFGKVSDTRFATPRLGFRGPIKNCGGPLLGI
jgi:hypothetical protein